MYGDTSDYEKVLFVSSSWICSEEMDFSLANNSCRIDDSMDSITTLLAASRETDRKDAIDEAAGKNSLLRRQSSSGEKKTQSEFFPSFSRIQSRQVLVDQTSYDFSLPTFPPPKNKDDTHFKL